MICFWFRGAFFNHLHEYPTHLNSCKLSQRSRSSCFSFLNTPAQDVSTPFQCTLKKKKLKIGAVFHNIWVENWLKFFSFNLHMWINISSKHLGVWRLFRSRHIQGKPLGRGGRCTAMTPAHCFWRGRCYSAHLPTLSNCSSNESTWVEGGHRAVSISSTFSHPTWTTPGCYLNSWLAMSSDFVPANHIKCS